MKARINSADKQTYEHIDVPEKLVVVSMNTVIYAIFERVYLSSLNCPVDVITACH